MAPGALFYVTKTHPAVLGEFSCCSVLILVTPPFQTRFVCVAPLCVHPEPVQNVVAVQQR